MQEYVDLQENWEDSIIDLIEVYNASVVATSTVIWASDVPAGTKRRILRIVVNNASATIPYKVTLRTKSAAGVASSIWSNRYIPAAGFVGDEAVSWKEPLASLEPGGNLYAGGDTSFKGKIEVHYFDDHLGLT